MVTARRAPSAPTRWLRFQQGFERAVRSVPRALPRAADRGARYRRVVRRGFLLVPCAVVRPRAVPRQELLSRQSKAGQIRLHVARPIGHADRGDRPRSVDRGRGRNPRRHPAASDRLSIVDNIGLPNSGINLAYGNSGTIGVSRHRHSDRAQRRGAAADRRLRQAAAGAAAAQISRRDVFVPARRHGQPDPELRFAGADRRADHRPEHAEQPQAMPPISWRRSAMCPASRTRGMQQAFQAPALNVDFDRTFAGKVGLTEHDAANDGAEHARGQHPDDADLLAQPEERRVLADRPSRRRNTGSTRSTACKNMPITGARQVAAIARRHWRPWTAGRRARSSPTTTSSRRSTFSPRRRAAISARVAGDIQKILDRSRAEGAAASAS